jgi:hypothetical protein
MLDRDDIIDLIFSTSSGKYVPEEAQPTAGGSGNCKTGKI